MVRNLKFRFRVFELSLVPGEPALPQNVMSPMCYSINQYKLDVAPRQISAQRHSRPSRG